MLSPGLSAGDVGEAVGGGVVLTLSLVAGRVEGSVWGVVSTVISLVIVPGIIRRVRGEGFCGRETHPVIISRGVESCALQNEVRSTWLPS